jgi:myo-inositol-1(or 4)-monophosphatase
MNLLHAQEVAIAAAKEAGALLRRGLEERKVVSRKSSAVDLLTEHDQAAESIILERLQEAFPDHRIITEESEVEDEQTAESPFSWYIDPLDGTNNFAHGYPVFSSSIALYENGQPAMGVVYDPMRDECFMAAAGHGAYLNSANGNKRLHVSQTRELVDSLLATGFPYDRHTSNDDNLVQHGAFLKKALGVRRSGSAALDLTYVAAGRLDGFWEYRLSSWDVAAGVCLIREAGGTVSGMVGDRWQITPQVSLVASNGRIHSAMVSLLAKVTGQTG